MTPTAASGARRIGLPLAGWAGRMSAAARYAAIRSEAWPLALAGFLVRGGIVVFLLPVVVLPSVVGIAESIGLDSFTIARQPTTTLLTLVAAISLAVAAWIVAGAWIGGATDRWLIGDTIAAVGGETGPGGPAGGPGLPASASPRHPVLRMNLIRLACLVPLFGAIAYASVRIYDAAYFELLTPVDLATPLVWRVIVDALDGVLVLLLVWVLVEGVAALAVRRFLLVGRGGLRALVGALAQFVFRPASTLATIAVTFAVSAIAVGVPLAGAWIAFDWCRIAARTPIPFRLELGPAALAGDLRVLVLLVAAAVLVAAWLLALALSAVTSSWRSAAYTLEVAAALGTKARPEAPRADGTFESGE